MKKTKIIIVSGFLGSGKTSFIKKFLDEFEDKSSIVIIENEFGEVSIDSAILSDTGISIREINAGCICCSVSGDFTQAMYDIKKEFNPELIIIEPSGIAKLSDIKNGIDSDFEIINSVTVVDVERFFSYLENFGAFYKDQIANANTLVLSRTSDRVEDIKEKILSINPDVMILDGPWSDFRFKDFLKSSKPIPSLEIQEDSDENFESHTFIATKKFEINKLEKVLERLNDEHYGQIVRAKGFVKTKNGFARFDFVPNEISTHEFKNPKSDSNYIVVIGLNLNKKAIEGLFHSFLRITF